MELTKALATPFNVQIKYAVCPWKRNLYMMENGEADILSSVLKRPDREEYMIFLEPPYRTKSTKVFYVLKGKAGLIRKYEDLYALRIGTKLGVNYFERFDNDSGLKKEDVADDVLNLRKLEGGRFDTFICTEMVGDYLIAKEGFKGKFEKAVFRFDTEAPVYFAVSKKSSWAKKVPELSVRIKEMVEKIIKDFFDKLNQ